MSVYDKFYSARMENLTRTEIIALLTPEMKEDILKRVKYRYKVVTTVNGSLKLQTVWKTNEEAEHAKEQQLKYWSESSHVVSSCVTRELDL